MGQGGQKGGWGSLRAWPPPGSRAPSALTLLWPLWPFGCLKVPNCFLPRGLCTAVPGPASSSALGTAAQCRAAGLRSNVTSSEEPSLTAPLDLPSLERHLLLFPSRNVFLSAVLEHGVGVHFRLPAYTVSREEGALSSPSPLCPRTGVATDTEQLCVTLVSRVGRSSRGLGCWDGNQDGVGSFLLGEPSENLGTIKCPPGFPTGDRRSREGDALVQIHVASWWQSWDLTPEPFGGPASHEPHPHTSCVAGASEAAPGLRRDRVCAAVRRDVRHGVGCRGTTRGSCCEGVRKRSRLKPEGVGPSVRAITWHVTPDESASVPGTSFLI